MLKYKVIRAFVTAWCAVCLMYVGVRTALVMLLNTTARAEAVSDTAEGQVVPEVEVTTVPEASEKPQAKAEAMPETEAVPEAEAAPKPEATPAPILDPEPTDKSEPKPESQPKATGTTDDLLSESDGGSQETEALEAPSLDEYLSQYTCGSCRRNCSLDNPRCHNGSRLAQAKAQEYYELYG